MNDSYIPDISHSLNPKQTQINDERLMIEEIVQQRLANLIAENQYLQQQLKQSKKRENELYQENLAIKQEFQTLKEQKTFLETLLQQVADGILIISHQGKIHFVNEAAEALFGRSAEELQDYHLGYPISDGLTEIFLHRPDQTHITAQLRVTEITWNQHTAYLVSLRDVTQEKQSQAKLAESEARFRLLANTAPVLIWMTNAQGKLIFVNHSWSSLTGRLHRGIIGSKWLKAIHPDDFSDYWVTMHEAINHKTSFQNQFRLEHPQNGYQWLLNRGVPRFTPEGEFLGFIGSCVDISEHKQLEEQLLEVTQAVDCSGEAIAILKPQGKLIYQNTAFLNLFGYSPQEINQLGGLNQIFPKKQNIRLSNALEVIREGQSSWRGELILKQTKGQKQQIALQIDRIVNLEGHLLGFVVAATDITQRKQIETELKQTNRQLKNSVHQLENNNQEIAQLSNMVELLQGCFTPQEAYQVLEQQIPRLFSRFSGGLFILDNQKQLLEALVIWGKDCQSENTFNFHDCWGLRRGNLHWSLDPNYLPCPHQHPQKDHPLETLCVPLSARGEIFGLLYLSRKKTKKAILSENQDKFCQMVAEHIGMALANLKLCEKLKQESIRDPLTHLYNRRYLEASLEQEIARSLRKNTELSIVMLDIDHFKHINDDYSHAAGDLVLRKLGTFLQKNIRGSDIACRFGGEELTLIFPETTLQQATYRTEQLRNGIKGLQIEFQGQSLRMITASFGIASFPNYGKTGQDILHIADLALYRAKELGRDCIVTADAIFNH